MDLSGRIDRDFFTREWTSLLSQEETVTFKNPEPTTYKKEKYDWYIIVALSKADKVKQDRHLLTADLLLRYRWAIREGFNHGLDPALRNQLDEPRNRNTVAGIQAYIEKISKASEAEMSKFNKS